MKVVKGMENVKLSMILLQNKDVGFKVKDKVKCVTYLSSRLCCFGKI